MLTRRSFLLGSSAALALAASPIRFDWDAAEQEFCFSYQWYIDGEPVEGATGKSFDIPKDAVNARITCRVIATNSGNG